MKRTIIMMAAAAILATGCKNNSNNQNECKDAAAFADALAKAYPDMPGDIAPLAEALYK